MLGQSRLVAAIFTMTAVILARSGSSLCAQAALPDLSRPLTFENALDLATSRNLGLEAARRQRAIRDAAVRTARQLPNPEIAADVTQDTPHYGVMFNIPVEIGGKRTRRIDLAKQELTLADVDVQSEMRSV